MAFFVCPLLGCFGAPSVACRHLRVKVSVIECILWSAMNTKIRMLLVTMPTFSYFVLTVFFVTTTIGKVILASARSIEDVSSNKVEDFATNNG